MELAANSICSHTNTLPKNIYVYFHEMEPENVRKTAPTARIDWTMIPDRTNEAKKAIMGELTDELASLPGRIEAKSQSSSTTFPFRMPCWEESPGQTTTTGKQTQAIPFRFDGGGFLRTGKWIGCGEKSNKKARYAGKMKGGRKIKGGFIYG